MNDYLKCTCCEKERPDVKQRLDILNLCNFCNSKYHGQSLERLKQIVDDELYQMSDFAPKSPEIVDRRNKMRKKFKGRRSPNMSTQTKEMRLSTVSSKVGENRKKIRDLITRVEDLSTRIDMIDDTLKTISESLKELVDLHKQDIKKDTIEEKEE